LIEVTSSLKCAEVSIHQILGYLVDGTLIGKLLRGKQQDIQYLNCKRKIEDIPCRKSSFHVVHSGTQFVYGYGNTKKQSDSDNQKQSVLSYPYRIVSMLVTTVHRPFEKGDRQDAGHKKD
jgi:hypothetical protein